MLKENVPEFKGTLTLKNSKVEVLLVLCFLFIINLKDGWRIAGASDMARIPSISIKVEV